ncbi:hypothetical protein SB4_10545 [Sphingomonas sanguinis]|uniref:Uncharacterized protein n=1 Tax=Sphingomonas sanguinis TaxID=33051 RepID=A0A147IT31_9SPHN|nr:hypothetical protein SB4_10545 [Sphingomonas sanguinis]
MQRTEQAIRRDLARHVLRRSWRARLAALKVNERISVVFLLSRETLTFIETTIHFIIGQREAMNIRHAMLPLADTGQHRFEKRGFGRT